MHNIFKLLYNKGMKHPKCYIPLLFLVVPTIVLAETLDKWSDRVFIWAQLVIIPVSTTIFIFAGITYMTSGGNPNRVAFAKKLITGAVSAILVLYLGKYFLKIVLGVG